MTGEETELTYVLTNNINALILNQKHDMYILNLVY